MSNFSELLRSFLGLPRRGSGRLENDEPDGSVPFDDRRESDAFDWSSHDEDDFPSFTFAESEALKDFQSAICHMEELMSGFHQSFGSFGGFGMPLLPADRDDLLPDGRAEDDKSIRDRMLKAPGADGDSDGLAPWRQRPFRAWPFLDGDHRSSRYSGVDDKFDRDLDTELEQRSATLSDILPSYDRAIVPRADSSASTASAFRFTSVRTVRKPDGSVETHRITRGSDGTEEEVVTRVDPNGKEQRVTTRRDARGNVLSERDDQEQPALAMPKPVDDGRQLQDDRPRSLVELLKKYFRPTS